MIKRNNKKGFTIVELVIVIAVIAILAAVLIPTFSGIIRKANISADTQVAKNLNTLLVAAEAEGDKPENFTDVVQILKDNGYIISNLNPTTSGCYYVWESESNQIILVDGKNDYAILYKAKDCADAGATWNFAIGNATVAAEVKAYFDSKSTPVTIQFAVTEVDDLTELFTSAKKDEPLTVYMDESFVMTKDNVLTLNNANADITIVLGESNVTATTPIEDKIPFAVEAGTLTIAGGTVASTGRFENPDGLIAHAPVVADKGATLNVSDTTFNIDAVAVDGSLRGYLRYQGGNGTLDKVTITSNDMGILANNGSDIVLNNCNITALNRTVWSCSYDGTTHPADDGNGNIPVVTINGGKYTTTSTDTNHTEYATVATCGGKIVITDGTFENKGTGVLFSVYGNKNGPYGTDEITIKGGNFVVDGKTMTFDELKASVGTNDALWAKIARNATSVAVVDGAIVLK